MMIRNAVAIAALVAFFPVLADNSSTAVAAFPMQGPAIPLTTAPTLEALRNAPSKATTGIPDLRAQMLHDAAHTLGFRGGLAARTQELLTALNRRADALSLMFLFAPLMGPSGTLPPVIEAAKDVAAFSPDQVRTAHQVYKIKKEERFVSTPPTWRDYLLVGLSANAKVELPELHARPQDDREATLWRNAVTQGWAVGRKQADAILEANFNRLVRDYTGMMTYSTLVQSGMISTTRVAESKQTVTGDAQQIILGDTLRRVTSKAGFETDPRKWRARVRSVPATAPASTPAEGPSSR